MRTSKRVAITLLSVGWIAPLSVAFSIGRSFAWLTYQLALGRTEPVPWHAFEFVDGLFYFAMLWMALAIGVWTFALTKRF